MRHSVKLFLAGAAFLSIASCSNDAVGPSRSAPPILSRTNPALAALATPAAFDFVIPAQGGTVSVMGMYKVSFPANAVCDPSADDSRDGYAAGAWDAPCTVLGSDLTVHATLKWSHKRLWIDFSPAIRFEPSAVVTIWTDIMAPVVEYYSADGTDASGGLSRTWGIAYAPGIDVPPVNDAALDPSTATTIDFATGRISRRIKHFSGYNILMGTECDPADGDPYCIEAH
jgi:hypothetical protein